MDWIQDNGLTYLQFSMFAKLPRIFHGVFLKQQRPHGKSQVFNLGLQCGTPDDQVWHNRQKMLNTFGNNMIGIYAHQVHGTQVGIWEADPTDQVVRIQGDALITAKTSGALVIQTADCQPVILVDPVQQVVANVHSGWRGSINNILGHTIDTLKTQFGSRAADLICGIGPSLGPCCAQFVNFRQEIPEPYWKYRYFGDLFDFWQISVDQLLAAGVPSKNIALAQICTKCNQHLFFSYRGDQLTGRFATVVGIHSS